MEKTNKDRFVKELTKTDVEDKLSVPSKYVSYHRLNHHARLQVADFDSGNVYEFQLSLREAGNKPTFMFQGWHRFVVEKQLRIGDKIYFDKMEDGTFRIKVLPNSFSRIVPNAETGISS